MGHLVEGGSRQGSTASVCFQGSYGIISCSALQAIDTSCHLCYDFCYSLKKEKKKVKEKRDRGKTSNEKGKC